MNTMTSSFVCASGIKSQEVLALSRSCGKPLSSPGLKKSWIVTSGCFIRRAATDAPLENMDIQKRTKGTTVQDSEAWPRTKPAQAASVLVLLAAWQRHFGTKTYSKLSIVRRATPGPLRRQSCDALQRRRRIPQHPYERYQTVGSCDKEAP